jgi:hypothetical protein
MSYPPTTTEKHFSCRLAFGTWPITCTNTVSRVIQNVEAAFAKASTLKTGCSFLDGDAPVLVSIDIVEVMTTNWFCLELSCCHSLRLRYDLEVSDTAQTCSEGGGGEGMYYADRMKTIKMSESDVCSYKSSQTPVSSIDKRGVTGCRFWIIPEISGCCCC